MSSRRLLVASAALLACTLPFAAAHAQGAWKPDRPVRLLVGFAPGGSADVLARLIAEPLGQKLGQPVVVENVAGAGGNIATGRLVNAAADGYTLGIAAAGSMAITFELNPKGTPYKPTSFTPITMVASQPNVLIVNKDVPANNLQEFKAYVARTPSASYGIAGIGISNHLIAEAMLHRLGVKMEAIPYKGAAPVIADLLGGHLAMTMDNITTAAALANDGKVKALGVTSAQRAPQLPNVPTLQEQGLAGFDMPTWQGVFAPAGLPAPILQAYYEALQEIVRQPGTVEKMARLGSQPVAGMEPAKFASFLEADRRQWAGTIKAANIKAE